MAGQEGFEPPTPGFGVRCSTNSSYWPASNPRRTCQGLLGLFVRRMFFAKTAILAELQFVRRRTLVFGGRIVSALTLGAGQCYDDSHLKALLE